MSPTNFTMISCDGHATARMADYAPYLDPEFREEFSEFVPQWEKFGSRNFDPPALRSRTDPEVVDEWQEKMIDTGNLEGNSDPLRRLEFMETQGVVAEVLFPDFGLPFELYSPSLASVLGYPPLRQDQIEAGARAYNRWLADFVSVAPNRFAGMARVTWDDVDETIKTMHAVKAAGLKGVVLPMFSREMPLYHSDFDPIWSTLEDLELVANSHAGMSATANDPIYTPGAHAAVAVRVWLPETTFFCHNILNHLIWGGVLERHPRLTVAFTEQGSDWVVPELRSMDYSYTGSYRRRDHGIPLKPSEYFERQCYMGSSAFSKAEIELRHTIGISKMMIGMDYPHHEGTLIESTQNYLRATLGAAGVSVDEARVMLGQTAAAVFGFDLDYLGAIAAGLDASPESLLRPPEEDLYPRGDVHKPALI
jgi:predicted TIM-barrel fold metal-dependent hydrolase